MSIETPSSYEELVSKIEDQEINQLSLNKQINLDEQIIKQTTEQKKEELNQEYLSNLIGSFLGKEALKGTSIEYSINKKEAIINGRKLNLITSIPETLVKEQIQDFFEREYFVSTFGKNIYDYISNRLVNNNTPVEKIKTLLSSPEQLTQYLNDLGSETNINFDQIIQYLGNDYLSDLSTGLTAKLYMETGNKSYLSQKGGIESQIRGLVGDEYMENYENANPLLKTAVVGGGSIYGIFKLISWVHSKVSGEGGPGWFKLIFGGAAVELIGQVVMGKSLTGSAIKEVSKVFQGTDNGAQLEETAKLLESKDNTIALGDYRALTYILGNTKMETGFNFNFIKERNGTPAQKEMITFICEQNNISTEELHKHVIEGSGHILHDITQNISLPFEMNDLSEVKGGSVGDTFNEKTFAAIERSQTVKAKIDSLHQNGGGTALDIATTYKEEILLYIKNGETLEMGI